ncbi:ubiquitin-like protein [Nocardia sp. NPDC050712]|uniref:ubiquitin-like protein n=1 Tax=Nocardia sp. NPDC050712 TaxID=3155518 RepID=UPI0033D15F81
MDVFGQTASGSKYLVSVGSETTVLDFKTVMAALMPRDGQIPVAEQRVAFDGKILRDSDLISGIENVREGSALFVMAKTRGKWADQP